LKEKNGNDVYSIWVVNDYNIISWCFILRKLHPILSLYTEIVTILFIKCVTIHQNKTVTSKYHFQHRDFLKNDFTKNLGTFYMDSFTGYNKTFMPPLSVVLWII